MASRGLLLVVALALTAGCGGLGADPTPEPVTPAPVPTPEPPAAPGVTEHDVETATVLDRHEAALENRSFALRDRVVARSSAGEVRFERTTNALVAADGRFSYDRRWPVRTDPWRLNRTHIQWDGERATYRFTYVSGLWDIRPSVNRPTRDLTRSDYLGSVLATMTVQDVSLEPDGDVEVVGAVSEPAAIATPGPITDPRNATVRLRIGSEGLVSAAAVHYDATLAGNRTQVRHALGIEGVGETTLPGPTPTPTPTGTPA